MKIGIFDSGVGGITFLNEVLHYLPNESFIYYADRLNAPYGTKSKDVVINHIDDAVEFLAKKNIKALVVACNTATSININKLRNNYKFPILGMEPAIKPAIEISNGKRVLVLATPLTIKEEKLDNLICKINGKALIDLLATPELVEFAEKKLINDELVDKYFYKLFKDYDMGEYGAIVLGCTHFPYFKKKLENILPKSIKVIDGNIGTAKHLKKVLEQESMLNDSLEREKTEFYCSSKNNEMDCGLSTYLELLKEL